MNLKARITEDMKTALKAKDAQRLGAIRLLLAAVKQVEVDKRIELTDADVTAIIERELKKRRDSISQYRAAGREELARNEEFEAEVLTGYLPAQADAGEIAAVIDAAIAAAGVTGPAAMGKVMGAVKAKLAGRADMTAVSAQVKARLAS
jgi:uncharacterized protein YqeY